MAEFQVTGSAQLAALSRALKQAGRNDLRKELLRGLRTAAAPAKRTVPASARVTLPRRGGLNETVASNLQVSSRTSLAARGASVRIVAADPPQHHIADMDRGRLRHPVYGNRENWVTQPIHPLFFTRPMLALRPGAQREMAAALDRIARSLVT